MNKIRILVVDDSLLVRRLLSNVLSEQSGFEITTASSGRIALDRISLNLPDLIILDIEMPDINGLEMLKRIRKDHPALPVIMFSRLTERGASITMDALFLGANDYVTKPSAGGVDQAKKLVRETLIPKIKTFCFDKMVSKTAFPPVRVQHKKRKSKQRAKIIAIGVSTGGPNALAKVLSCLPADFPTPIVIVQHMPPVFSKSLAERLSVKSSLIVKEAASDDELMPGRVFIAPGGFHMILKKKGAAVIIQINQDPPVNNSRPSVDVLFQSVADIYGPYSLAVILTGMGHDGLKGCEYINAAGGQILAQDKASSSVWGMPGVVANAGLAHKILDLNKIGSEIIKQVYKNS
ncbi:Protein-glutamate methylesterase/protein-glutamine glutaminase [Candidatus Magnetomoraceae bacterium gMMP-15]